MVDGKCLVFGTLEGPLGVLRKRQFYFIYWSEVCESLWAGDQRNAPSKCNICES